MRIDICNNFVKRNWTWGALFDSLNFFSIYTRGENLKMKSSLIVMKEHVFKCSDYIHFVKIDICIYIDIYCIYILYNNVYNDIEKYLSWIKHSFHLIFLDFLLFCERKAFFGRIIWEMENPWRTRPVSQTSSRKYWGSGETNMSVKEGNIKVWVKYILLKGRKYTSQR